MEIQNQRVFAYELATELKTEELEDVSGGNGNLQALMTVKLSSYQSPDLIVDH